MKKQLRLQQRLMLPIILLGVLALLSNGLAVFNIQNVNSNAAEIVDHHMSAMSQLDEIRHSVLNIHRMALSHIVASDYNTMITVVGEIKAEEALLEERMERCAVYVPEEMKPEYQSLLNNYADFKRALVYLVCASADSKTQEAYALANGDVASFGAAATADMNELKDFFNTQTEAAKRQLTGVYIFSLCISVLSILLCAMLVWGAVRIILRYVMQPIQNAIGTLRESSERLNDVVGGVRSRTKTSVKGVQALSAVSENMALSFQHVSGSTEAINHSAGEVRDDVNVMAAECSEIAEYAAEMRSRANELEQSAQENMKVIRGKTNTILAQLEEAIRQSESVNKINELTQSIVSIATSTNLIAVNASIEAARAGSAGEGFEVVAKEIRQLSDSCAATAEHIQQVNKTVAGAVGGLAHNAQEMADYLSDSILTEFGSFVETGKQYRQDAAYIGQAMESFQERTSHLQGSVAEIADSIDTISKAIADNASQVAETADSTRNLVDDMADINLRMKTNRGIVKELQKQTEVFANL